MIRIILAVAFALARATRRRTGARRTRSRSSRRPASCAPRSTTAISVLAQKGPDGEPRGVSADLSRELAKRLGVPLEFVTFTAAGKAFEAAKENKIDVLFVAIEPVRAAEVEFTPPYVLIEGAYLVPEGLARARAGRPRPARQAHRGRREFGLRPLPHAHAEEREALARRRRLLQEHRPVPRREARCRGGRAPAARRIRETARGRARDGKAVPANPPGDGHAERPHRRGRLSAHASSRR